MNLLLDTQSFIWLSNEPDRLPSSIRSALYDPSNLLFVSVVSAWEMQIKVSLGKLTLPAAVKDFLQTQRVIHKIQSLPVLERHIWALATLPLHHRDPFDRLLIAQTIAENWILVTAAPFFTQDPVSLLK